MSLFALTYDITDIQRGLKGMNRMQYDQNAPTRDIANANFPNGQIEYRWEVSGQKHWIPSTSYLRLRVTLTNNAGNQLANADDIAPNMGLCANLFQSCEFRINDKTVSRISENLPQVDALNVRLNKSASWLNTVGNSSNFWSSEFKDRQSAVSSDVKAYELYERKTPNAGGNAALTAATRALVFATDQINLNVGDYINFTTAGFKSKLVFKTDDKNWNVEDVHTGNIAGTIDYTTTRVSLSPDLNNRNVSTFELLWQPPLSVFGLKHALPAGKYSLVLTPQPDLVYQKYAIESTIADRTSPANFNVNVSSMYLYTHVVEGERVDNATYYLDLKQLSCQKDVVTNTQYGAKNFDVSPSTTHLTVAYQSTAAGTNSLRSASKFKCVNNEELNLTRLMISYAGQQFPSPDWDGAVTATTDTSTQRYLESLLYSGEYFTEGQAESLKEFQNRGAYYHFNIPREGTDRSTRVAVNSQFSALVNPANVLLFSHSKQIARVKISEGRVVDVQVQDD